MFMDLKQTICVPFLLYFLYLLFEQISMHKNQ